jgi:ketosteroid isomerase-like protein
MKRPFLVFIGFVSMFAIASCTDAAKPEISAVVSAAPAAPAAPVDENVEAVITQLERSWAEAIVKKDFATLEHLLSDDFNGTSPTAHTFTKTAAIEDLKSGKYVVTVMDLDEISVNVYGDTAVAFTSQEEKSTYFKKDFSGHYHFTDVWIKQNGLWQVVASHGSRYNNAH